MNQVALSLQPSNEKYWNAIIERDRSFDGKVYYSVATTGVYCKPSCASRRPRRENVDFHSSPERAAAAGYRPCKRCRPNDAPKELRRAAQAAELCRQIESSEEPPSIEQLAAHIGASPSHTHRIFKAATGVTPKQYADEHRRQRLRRTLQNSRTVTEAIYASGYGSAARFYSSAESELGMKPQVYRSGGKGEAIRFAIAESSLGPILVAATARGLCSILLGDDPQALIDDLARRFPRAQLVGAEPDFEHLVARVVGLVDQPSRAVELPLDIQGTSFQQRVWAALMQIPPGQTATYSEIAKQLGMPTATRAVAGACAANALAVAVPCHRVVRQDGGLSGYRWGVERKRQLLKREAQDSASAK